MTEFFQALLNPFFLWMAVGLALIILEFTFPGLIVIFFGFGAILTAIVTAILSKMFVVGFTYQIIMFVIFSLASLFTLRKYARKIFYGEKRIGEFNDLSEDDFSGKKAVVVDQIEANHIGKVEFQGTNWSASATETIKKGEIVTIISHDNLTLNVAKENN